MFIAHQLMFYELLKAGNQHRMAYCNNTICTMLVPVRPHTLNPILYSAY